MVNGMFWVACLSQTGSELLHICNSLGIAPDAILSTNEAALNEDVLALGAPVFYTNGRPTLEQYSYFFKGAELITLHGFLYIIPKSVCDELQQNSCRVFNGHPALLTRYPELKGKDKQEDVYYQKEKYPYIGSVIHECIAELDAGDIVIAVERSNTVTSLEEAYAHLKQTSLQSWMVFFNRILSERLAFPWELIQPEIQEYN